MFYENDYYQVNASPSGIFFKNKKGGVVILPLTPGGDPILINHYRHSIGDYVLELPRGFKQEGEDAIESAQRELKEELNIVSPEWIYLGYVYPDSGIIGGYIDLFMACRCEMESISVQTEEYINSYKIIPIDKLIKQVCEGKINDGFTIACLFRGVYALKGGIV